MSKKLLTFFLNELKTVRIHCSSSQCGGVVEIPISQLSSAKKQAECPACGAGLRLDNSLLNQLGSAINGLVSPESYLWIEFVIPQNQRWRKTPENA